MTTRVKADTLEIEGWRDVEKEKEINTLRNFRDAQHKWHDESVSDLKKVRARIKKREDALKKDKERVLELEESISKYRESHSRLTDTISEMIEQYRGQLGVDDDGYVIIGEDGRVIVET